MTWTRLFFSLCARGPEILGGVREGDVISATKIPYKPDEWLNEQDPERKQYLACHCPMARASLKPPVTSESQVPPVWCHCSAGYEKLMFDVIFDEPWRLRSSRPFWEARRGADSR